LDSRWWCALGCVGGIDRDRVFYPTLLAVIATCYILFAVMESSMPAPAIQSTMEGAFFVLAVTGFKADLWLVVAALAGLRILRLLPSLARSQSGRPTVVARLPPFFRHLRRRFPGGFADRRSGFARYGR
jgi:hypothetical protein